MYRVFVSHSSRDTVAARAVVQWLTEQEPSLDGDIYLDVDPQTGIAPGTRWKSELVRAVDRCEAVICLISPNWESAVECVAEFRHAETLNKRIFIARLYPDAKATTVREWQFCDLFVDGNGEASTVELGDGTSATFATDGLGRLLRGLREAGVGAEHFPWPPLDDPRRAPYRGWQPMEAADAAVFFGRDPQILRGLDTIRGMRAMGVEGLFVVLGPSGVGKSSFLRAGLLPRLRRDPKDFTVCHIVRPERAVLTGDHGLAQAIWQLRSSARLDSPALGDIKTTCLAGDASQVTTWLREAQRDLVGDGEAPTLVLPIDQAEELFAAEAGPEAVTFLALLGSLLRGDALNELPLIAVATIRADRYELLQSAAELVAVHTREFGDLKPMPVTEFKEVITGPAARASAAGLRLSLDPALVAQLLNDASSGADSLPLLALSMSRLYLDYGSTGELTLANYRSMGGIQQIVNTEMATLLAPDDATRSVQLDALRSAFIPWLATVDPTTDQVLRRVARWEELPPESHELIDAMVARRLLVKDVRGGETVVEVALESLFRQWDSLAEWLREQAENLKAVDNLERAAADWGRNQRGEDWLIEGVRLAAAEQLATSPTFADRVGHAAEFLRASREREEAEAHAELRKAQERRDEAEAHAAVLRKRGQVLRAVLAVTLVVALVAVGGLVYANIKRREADDRGRDALAAQLISQAQSILVGGQPGSTTEAITKVLAAQKVSASPDRGAMLTALNRTARLVSVTDAPNARFLSADGTRIAAQTDAGIQLLDTATGTPVGKPFGHPADTIYASSPDGRYLALLNKNEIRVWDSGTGHPIGEPILREEAGDPRAVSPDGHQVAIEKDKTGVRLWNVATGQQIGHPVPGRFEATEVVFSPDGHRLAASTEDGGVRLWDTATGAAVGQPIGGGHSPEAGGYIQSIAFSPDGHTVAAAATARNPTKPVPPLQVWNADTADAIGTHVAANYGAILSMAYSPEGSWIVTGGSDKMMRLWNAHTGQPAGEPIGLHDQVSDVMFTQRGDRIVAVSGNTVQIYDADPNAGMLTDTGASKILQADASPSVFGAWSTTDGPRVIVRDDIARDDGAVRLLNADTGQQVGRPIITEDPRPALIDLSPDGRWLVIWWSTGDEIRIIDTTNGQPDGKSPIRHQAKVNTVKFSPDGQVIASAWDDKTIRLWDLRTGRQVGDPIISEKLVDSLQFSGDGHHLLAGTWGEARIWDVATSEPIGKPIPGGGSNLMAISPDGRRIAAVRSAIGQSLEIDQWDIESGSAIGAPMKGHTVGVNSIAYGPGGDYLVSAGSDGTLRFWDTTTGRQLGDPIVMPGEQQAVEVSHDGRRIFINEAALLTSGGHSSRVLEVPAPAAWRDKLCDKLTRNPSEEQWKQWVSPDIPYTEICPGKS